MVSPRHFARLIELQKLDLGDTYDAPCGLVGGENRTRYYPSIWISGQSKAIDLPKEGEGKIRFRVTSRSANTDRDGKTKYGATVEVLSIETPEKDARLKKLSAAVDQLVELASDPRPRNGLGQYENQDQGPVVDSNTVAAAYGGVIQQKKQRHALLARAWRNRQMVPPLDPNVTAE
jgi:hypothetical protein